MHNPAMPAAFPPGAGGGIAAQRAAQQLQNHFGQRAAASINAIQQSGMNSGPVPPHLGQQGQQTRPVPPAQQALYAQQQRAQMQQAQQAQQGQLSPQQQQQQRTPQNGVNGLPHAQVDGAGEAHEGILMKGGRELGRVEIDEMLHEKFAARAKQMEGGGLMLPLKEAAKQRSGVAKKRAGGIPQGDAADQDPQEEAHGSIVPSPADARQGTGRPAPGASRPVTRPAGPPATGGILAA